MNIQQLIGPDELANMIGRPLPVIFEKSWQLGNVLSKWKVANVTYVFKKKKKEKETNTAMREINLNHHDITKMIERLTWYKSHNKC